MEKKSNSKKGKLEINSLEHLLLENVVDRESTQIKGGCGSDTGVQTFEFEGYFLEGNVGR